MAIKAIILHNIIVMHTISRCFSNYIAHKRKIISFDYLMY